ncbi:NUDIX domain-containing protein [Actinomadura geliboluensis]|uniref:NUDIX domain-containing protein n=1 Tax=Actinomadura geliboluensis TaxID=882440 RepID=UPI002632413D|nr:NUDIX domain-containing protein [Actinomadura geliboluensis]
MIDFVWSEEPVPPGVPVRQVHGWLVDEKGRFLVQDRFHERRFLLAGGRCELSDADWASTLIREAIEESQVVVDRDSVRYLGHQVVTGDPAQPCPYGQVRLFGVIAELTPSAPDPDSGHVYGRLLTSFQRAVSLLEWGEPGEFQALAAARAGRDLGLPVDAAAPEGYV